ncbi:N-acetylneuraminate epimerase [Rubripirellula obstinata]|uniref:N-acetylneuraminate epimerase n=1 Tax=Rubripirellula obstinata TaxID=406547 RepID=A0A5B1CHX5_9BACT|nr:PQQ-binding-like beta-propeller repeat protein [Rubripirellula obstinata]KAA1260156.1 N-acetylneuraminate epimerase [Rubripirellula obstinata]
MKIASHPFQFAALSLLALHLVILATTQTAHAHMAWLGSNDEQQVEFWFGDSPSDRTYHMPAKVAAIQLHADQNDQAIVTAAVEEDELVGLRSKTKFDSDAEISGSVTYGLYHGMKLTYHVEHLPSRDSSTWPTTARQNVALQSVITPAPQGGVLVSILDNGKPAKDVEVKLYCEEGHEEDSQTTDSAGMVTFGKDVVEGGLNAIMVGLTDKNAKGELDGEAYTSAANYLTATFFHDSANHDPDSDPDSGESTKPKKKTGAKVDPNSGVSISESGLPDLPEDLTSFGAAIAGDKLYAYGGHTGDAHSYSTAEQSDRFWCLDLSAGGSGEWKELDGGPRLQGLALVANGDDLIRIGGFTAMNEIGDDHDLHSQSIVAKYSPATKQWTRLPDLPEPRSSLDAAVLNNRVYVFGGWQMQGEGDDASWHDTAWSLDLSTGDADWQAIATPPFQRRAISVAAHDEKLYVIGGMQAVGGPTTRVDIYDPATDTWTEGPAIPGSGMSGFGSSAFDVGGVLYVSTMDGFVHALDRSAKDWRTVAKSDPARFFHRMLPAQNSTLLMIGGANMEIGKFTQIDAISLPKTH